jgi:hypothetical protein
MPSVDLLPEWSRTMLVGAVSALAGYAWKNWIEGRERKQRERTGTIAQLQDLKTLLDTSGKLFAIQQEQVRRLMNLLEQNHPSVYAQGEGYEDTIARCYSQFTAEETALHGIIRAYSEHSMRRVNEALGEWIEQDKQFKTAQVESARREELAARLRDLEMHLLLWHAKRECWLSNQPHHALVYMADEKAHGLGFPGDQITKANGVEVKVNGVDTEVALALEELREKWK